VLSSVLSLAAVLLTIYGIKGWAVHGTEARWIVCIVLGLVLGAVFLRRQLHHPHAMIDADLLCNRVFTTAVGTNAIGTFALVGNAVFMTAYLQLVLGYSPLEVGLAFLPANLIMGAFSIGLSAKLVMRYGFRIPLATGLLVAAAGLVLFARAPVDGNFVVDVLPSMILLGVGAGMAFNPVLLAAMSDVDPSESGLASGVVNTAFMMGGALGLAVLVSLASSRTDSLTASGDGPLAALNGGYHLAFLVGALFAAAAAVVGGVLLRTRHQAPAGAPVDATA